MYITFNNDTKKVVYMGEKKPISISDKLTLAEVETIPEKYDYLTVVNEREVTKTWTETIEELNDKNEVVTKEVEKSRTYTTCDLKACFKLAPSNEELEKFKGLRYKKLVARLVRERYSQDDVEAIINNYLFDPQDEKAQLEFSELQTYREKCKMEAHNKIYEE